MKNINDLIAENEYIVNDTISKYFPKYRNDDDIHQIGLIALWKAILACQKKKDAKLKAYAYIAIKNAIIDEIRIRKTRTRNKEKYEFMISLEYYQVDERDICDLICENQELPEKIYLPHDMEKAKVSKMKKKDKEIVLSFLKHHSEKQAMEECNVSRRTVFYAISRVKKDILGRL